jgi:hypothetical protein
MGAPPQRIGLVQVASLALLYTVLSFLWSLTGFISPTSAVRFHEYTLPSLAVEILGHISFGIFAGLATRRVGLTLLCGAEAILIDVDHLLSALNLPVAARLSHSIPFALVISAVFLAFPQHVVRKRTLALVTVASILSHLSYDILAGNGQFPLLAPFSFQFYDLPYFYWPILEAAAILVCAFVTGGLL